MSSIWEGAFGVQTNRQGPQTLRGVGSGSGLVLAFQILGQNELIANFYVLSSSRPQPRNPTLGIMPVMVTEYGVPKLANEYSIHHIHTLSIPSYSVLKLV
jgi:hypothetical protein